MGDLILPSLEIRNFRGFQYLQIERLGRVNLIVGKNNIGKTSLLEAIQLYAHKGAFSSIISMLEVREEGILYGNILTALKYLFYGRKDISVDTQPIKIGPVGSSEKTLEIAVTWDIAEFKDGTIHTRPLKPEESSTNALLSPRFNQHMGGQTISFPLEVSLPSNVLIPDMKAITSFFVTASGLEKRQLGDLWDQAASRGRETEDDILNALRIAAPGIERLYFIGDAHKGHERVPAIRVDGIDELIPLRSLGDGMQRIFSIVLALVNAKDGILLIDEVENGIHYSALLEVWQFIFRIANHLNVQVFTTTHSWDCLEAFQQAASEDQQEEALLIRLDDKNDGVGITLIDEKTLGAVVRTQMEVR